MEKNREWYLVLKIVVNSKSGLLALLGVRMLENRYVDNIKITSSDNEL